MSLSRRLLLATVVLLLPVGLSQCAAGKNALHDRELKTIDPAVWATSPQFSSQPPAFRGREGKKLGDEDSARLLAQGNLSLGFRDYQSSLLNYLEILKVQPERHDIRYRVGVIFLLNGQLEAAKHELARVLLKRPDMLEAHEALALVHLQEKNYSLAIEEFQTVLSKDSGRAKAHHFLGITYLSAGQTTRALASLETAVRLDPEQLMSYAVLGQVNLKLKKYPQAIEWLTKGLRLDPKNPKMNHHLGMALAALKRYPEALQAFMAAGDEAQALNNIGVHYYMEGRYDEAAKCFQKAIELRPTYYEEARINLHRALEKLYQTGDAG